MDKIKLPRVRFVQISIFKGMKVFLWSGGKWLMPLSLRSWNCCCFLEDPKRCSLSHFRLLNIATSVAWFRAKMQTVMSHLLYKMERGLTKLRGKHAVRRPHNMFVFVEQMNPKLVPDVSTRSAVWGTQQGTSNYGGATVRPYLRLHSVLH